jgi:hypothetical protein
VCNLNACWTTGAGFAAERIILFLTKSSPALGAAHCPVKSALEFLSLRVEEIGADLFSLYGDTRLRMCEA